MKHLMKKTMFTVKMITIFILALCFCGIASGADINWTDNGSGHLWSTSGNWNNGVPSSSDFAIIDVSGSHCEIDSSVTAICQKASIGHNNGTCYLDISGGSLTAAAKKIHVGRYSGGTGIINMSGGTININDNSYGVFNIGFAGNGTVNMTGGTINVKVSMNIPFDTGTGTVNLDGGTISCGDITMTSSGDLDITEGTLIIDGDETSTVNSYVTSGYITAYDGSGTVDVDYNVTNSGKTTVTGTSGSSEPDVVTFTNSNVKIEYDLNNGIADFFHNNVEKISDFYSKVKLPTVVTSKDYTSRVRTTNGSETIITCTGGGNPTMKQHFYLEGDDYFLMTVEMQGTSLSSNWMGPVIMDTTGGVDIGSYDDNIALCVPIGNAFSVSYNAKSMNTTGTSYEVGAFYDNTSRNGLVLGSVTHDTWKTGIDYSGSSNKLDSLSIYGGIPHPEEPMDHGEISGDSICSPEIMVGYYTDWRDGMEEFAGENTSVVPKLATPSGDNGGIPFGWKTKARSHGFPDEKMTYNDLADVSDFISDNLQNNSFVNDKDTVYMILAGNWPMLSIQDVNDLADYFHTNGQKAGIYWKPFCLGGGEGVDYDDLVPGSETYTWNDIFLRDDQNNPIVDRTRHLLDPTHPGFRERVDYQMDRYKAWGYDYVRFDFIESGIWKGEFYDTDITTGVQAYNDGMQYILDRIDGAMHVNLAISPLFPYQYAHSRRISNDVFYTIEDTKFQLNSTTYGWWLGNLYPYMDTGNIDYEVSGGNANEAKTRYNAGVITGMIVSGMDWTNTAHQNLAKEYFTNAKVNAVARNDWVFKAVEGDTGTNPDDIFVYEDANDVFYVAVFNYGTSSTQKSVDLARAGLSGTTTYATEELWSGDISEEYNTMSVDLLAYQSKLFKIYPGGVNEFYPTDDTFVNQGAQSKNYGSKSYVRPRGSGSSKEKYAYLKFTVSGISGTITAAKLKIKSEGSAIDDTTVYPVTGTWDENTLTWNNDNLTWGSSLDTIEDVSSQTWYVFDVSDEVDGNSTYTLGLKTTQDAANLDWYSKESANDPVLQISYEE